jgi:hypothetical protein
MMLFYFIRFVPQLLFCLQNTFDPSNCFISQQHHILYLNYIPKNMIDKTKQLNDKVFDEKI